MKDHSDFLQAIRGNGCAQTIPPTVTHPEETVERICVELTPPAKLPFALGMVTAPAQLAYGQPPASEGKLIFISLKQTITCRFRVYLN